MALPSFESCAKEYARSWSNGERPIFEGLAAADRPRRLEALQAGAGYFRIARNFHRRFDVELGLERLGPVLEILETFRSTRLGVDTLCPMIGELRILLGHSYGGVDVLSAATKFLWLLRRAPTIIYDSQAKVALGAPAGDYETYVELWRRGYRQSGQAIRQACAALPSQSVKAAPFSQGLPPEWFLQRVYDIYLWRAGAAVQAWWTRRPRESI